jgi:hypothetical protein
MIKIDFSFDTPHGKFADALHLPNDHGFSEAEIQAMKEQRRDNWIAVVTAPPAPEPETTKEIAGEVYQKLEGVPPAGAKLVEIDGVWYYKV